MLKYLLDAAALPFRRKNNNNSLLWLALIGKRSTVTPKNKSFGFQVSEFFLLNFCHQKPKLPMTAKFSPDPYKMITFCAGHIICMNEQIIWSYIFREEDFLKFQPMRIKNCEWSPYFVLLNQDEMREVRRVSSLQTTVDHAVIRHHTGVRCPG
jgi:hypothetical protein